MTYPLKNRQLREKSLPRRGLWVGEKDEEEEEEESYCDGEKKRKRDD